MKLCKSGTILALKSGTFYTFLLRNKNGSRGPDRRIATGEHQPVGARTGEAPARRCPGQEEPRPGGAPARRSPDQEDLRPRGAPARRTPGQKEHLASGAHARRSIGQEEHRPGGAPARELVVRT